MWNWHRVLAEFPHCRLEASGEAVGLPPGQMGNSEVGHLNLGAGFRVLQDLPRITAAVADGTFFANEALTSLAGAPSSRGGRLHLMGLVGPGGIHAVDEHLVAMVELAHRSGLPADRVHFHAFTDGRDTPPRSADAFVPARPQERFSGHARIATVSGRFYAMDRDQRWERTRRAYDAIVHGVGHAAPSAVAAVERGLRARRGRRVHPADRGRPCRPNRAARLDRASQLPGRPRAPAQPGAGPRRVRRLRQGRRPRPARPHDADRVPVADRAPGPRRLRPIEIDSLAAHLARRGMRQLHVAETEKYAHVTYFFNGGVEAPFPARTGSSCHRIATSRPTTSPRR